MKRMTALFLSFISIVLMSSCGKTDIEQKTDTTQTAISADEYSEYATKAENIQYDEKSGFIYVDNEIIVSAADGVTAEQINALVESYGGKVVSSIDSINEYQISFDSTYSYEEIQNIIADVSKSELVDESDENIVFPISGNSLEESKWADEWDDNMSCWNMDAIDCVGAWQYNKKFQKINVGVYDSQFFGNHNDLTYSELYKNEFQIYENKGTDSSHGTHVSGTIAAKFDQRGVCGVSPNAILFAASADGDFVSLDKIKQRLLDSFNYSYDTLYSLKYKVNHLISDKKCKVINISMGFSHDFVCSSAYGNKQRLEIINNSQDEFNKMLIKLLNKGYDFIICEASGNSNYYKYSFDEKTNTYHVDMDNGKKVKSLDAKYGTFTGEITDSKLKSHIIVVGAVEKGKNSYSIASYSQLGKTVEIIAPGNNIYSTITSDGEKSEYGILSGTSMACPHVTGVAAMVWGANPSLTGAEVKKIVCSSTDEKIGGYPMLNAKLAVEKALNVNLAEKSDKKKVEVNTFTNNKKQNNQINAFQNLVTPNDNDWDNLYLFLNTFENLTKFGLYGSRDYNYLNQDAKSFFNNSFFMGYNFLYANLFGEESIIEENISSSPDPKNIMNNCKYGHGTYYVYDEKRLKFICENVFNITFYNVDGCPDEFNYFHDGQYYSAREIGGLQGFNCEYKHPIINKDGTYTIEIWRGATDYDSSSKKFATATVGLKEIDNLRFWSVYNVNMIDNP